MPDIDRATWDDWQYLPSLFDQSPDLIVVVDGEGIIQYANPQAHGALGAGHDALAGLPLTQTGLPTSAATEIGTHVTQTIASGAPASLNIALPAGDRTHSFSFQISRVAGPDGTPAALLAGREAAADERETERLREEARLAETLRRIGAALAAELDLHKLVQILTDEATALTEAQFGSFFYNVVNQAGESYMLYTLSGVPREAFSRFPMPRNTAVFAPTFAGEGVVRSNDITKDPRYGKNSPYHGKPPGHLPVVSYLAVPVISRTGEVHGGLFFGHSEEGVFTEHHERVIVSIAAQAAVAIDNARLYQEATDALARRAVAEKELQISEERQRFAIEGAGIGTWHWDLVEGTMIWSDRCRALLGVKRDEAASEDLFIERVHPDDRARITEAIEMAVVSAMDIHAEFRVSLPNGAQRWLLCKGRSYGEPSQQPARFEGILQDITDRKRSEAALSEAYAKEHTIAATLQEALQPAAPTELPGVEVAAFYQPALDEASIGGDFYDVFSLDKSVYAFVVGDVSGKGLSAAAQVATVRNMLRCVLYQNREVGYSVTALNAVLTEHDLLAGFVTVFAGIFNAGERKLTYVSCGHEPALLRRQANNAIEELPAAGLPLGASGDYHYQQHEIALLAGDTLVIYTDGLSEAGPDRLQLLGAEGMAQILAGTGPNLSADAIKHEIVEGVQAFAGESLTDDACLVVALVK